MAGGQERILRRRIKSIQSTQKITRAQELIAASRIVRAQGRVRAAQPYSESITGVVADLASGGGGISSALLVPRPEVRRIAHIVIAADRGLCGAYNSNVLRTAEAAIAEDLAAGRGYSLITSGRKAEGYFRYRDYDIDASFTGFSDAPTYEDARGIGRAATRAFLDEETDLVEIIYTRFVSAGIQVVERQTLVPMARPEADTGESGGPVAASYEFEPSPDTILDLLLPRYVESRVFAALLNAAASEHASRQRAMKSATDNAHDLIVNLTRVMNRARQDSITTEIMEIVGGAEALRSSKAKLVSDDFLADTIEARRADIFEARTQSNS
jgi:F-type H+-transporting ATPase subunit gamma